MTSVCIRLPALLADRIGGTDTVEVSAETVDGALRALTARHPALRSLVLDVSDRINPLLVVFVNDTQLSADELRRRLRPGDRLDVVPAIEGGRG